MPSKSILANTPQSDGLIVGESTAATLGFHGTAATAQRASAAQALVATTALTANAAYVQAEMTAVTVRAAALTVLVNELQAALVAKGLIKGSA